MRFVWHEAMPQSSKLPPERSVTLRPPWSKTRSKAWDLNQLDFLFIENVGNLVCPSSYDLGEDLRVVLISVTEGEDKPLKYPTIFNSADVAVVTKKDLADAVEFNWETAYDNIQAVRPGMPVLKVSAKTGEGIEEYLRFLSTRLIELRQTTAV